MTSANRITKKCSACCINAFVKKYFITEKLQLKTSNFFFLGGGHEYAKLEKRNALLSKSCSSFLPKLWHTFLLMMKRNKQFFRNAPHFSHFLLHLQAISSLLAVYLNISFVLGNAWVFTIQKSDSHEIDFTINYFGVKENCKDNC